MVCFRIVLHCSILFIFVPFPYSILVGVFIFISHDLKAFAHSGFLTLINSHLSHLGDITPGPYLYFSPLLRPLPLRCPQAHKRSLYSPSLNHKPFILLTVQCFICLINCFILLVSLKHHLHPPPTNQYIY